MSVKSLAQITKPHPHHGLTPFPESKVLLLPRLLRHLLLLANLGAPPFWVAALLQPAYLLAKTHIRGALQGVLQGRYKPAARLWRYADCGRQVSFRPESDDLREANAADECWSCQFSGKMI